MNLLTCDELREYLHDANLRFKSLLESISHSLSLAEPVSGDIISSLLSELQRIGEYFRAGVPANRDRRLDDELGAYRRNLESLRDCLPTIHRHLLEERTRLQAERVRIVSAGNWAESSRQTL